MKTECNVLIIGSGISGSLVANMLLNSGVKDILMLEAGPNVKMENQRTWYDYITTANDKLPYDSLYDTKQDYESAGGTEPWQITGGRIIGRGGSTLHWGGWCPRFMPEDFKLESNTGQGIDWPFDYDELEPYYCLAEKYIGVAGVESPHQRDWRSEPYPLAGPKMPLSARPMIDGLTDKGYRFSQMPVARNTVPYNEHSQCITTGTCHYCPVGARFTGDQPLNKLQQNPEFTLQLGCPVHLLTMGSKNTIEGAKYTDINTGTSYTVSAQAVFLCAGSFEVPKLLQLSTSTFWPSGIGNDYDLVGRYLAANPYIYCIGEGEHNLDKLQQELNFPTLASRQWDTPEEQAQGKFLMNMAYDAPLIHPATAMYAGQTQEEIEQSVVGPIRYELQGGISPVSAFENRVSAASGTTRFGLPRTSIFTPVDLLAPERIDYYTTLMSGIFDAIGYNVTAKGGYPQRGDHAASTTRMANDASQGVVDDTMKVHGTDNLFVTCNAALPTLGAANLTLTLVATIIRAIDKTLATNPSWAK